MSSSFNPIPVPETPDDFRAVKSEFADPDQYPDDQIQLWLDAASLMLPPGIWGNLLGLGTILFVAFNLATWAEYMNPANLAAGQVPGSGFRGLVASEQAGSVSVTYVNALTLGGGAGSIFNRNLYGQNFLYYVNMVGHRPLQVNVPPWGGCNVAAINPYGWQQAGRQGVLAPGVVMLPNDPMSNVPVAKFLPSSVPGRL
jgi:hypothetical protein